MEKSRSNKEAIVNKSGRRNEGGRREYIEPEIKERGVRMNEKGWKQT